MNIFKGGDGLSKVLGFLLDFPHLSSGDNSEADNSEGRGTWILVRELTNPHVNLATGCWTLGWFPGSSASSYRGTGGSGWQCRQQGHSI